MRSLARRSGVMLTLLIACSNCTVKEEASMHPRNDAVTDLLRRPDPAYFEFDQAEEDELVDSLIVMDPFQGTAIGAPSSLDVDARDRLPVLWLSRETGLRGSQVVAMRNSTVIVSDLIRGGISIHDAFTGPKMIDLGKVPRSASGPPLERSQAEGVTVNVEMLDLRTVANLPWVPGRLAISLIIYDWASNTVLVELTRQGYEWTPEREAALRFPADEAAAIDERYSEMAASPTPAIRLLAQEEFSALERPGVTLVVPEGPLASEPACLIRAVVRIPLPPGSIVETPDRRTDPRLPAESVAGRAEPPAAVVSVMLILARLDEPRQRNLSLRLPIHSAAALRTGDLIDVAFDLDLKAAVPGGVPPGTYQVYLAVEQHLSGPHPLVMGKE